MTAYLLGVATPVQLWGMWYAWSLTRGVWSRRWVRAVGAVLWPLVVLVLWLASMAAR